MSGHVTKNDDCYRVLSMKEVDRRGRGPGFTLSWRPQRGCDVKLKWMNEKGVTEEKRNSFGEINSHCLWKPKELSQETTVCSGFSQRLCQQAKSSSTGSHWTCENANQQDSSKRANKKIWLHTFSRENKVRVIPPWISLQKQSHKTL